MQEAAALWVRHSVDAVRPGDEPDAEEVEQAQRRVREQGFSGLDEFDACYDTSLRPDAVRPNGRRFRWHTDIGLYLGKAPGVSGQIWMNELEAKEQFAAFYALFQRARALVVSVIDETASRALPMRTQLSLAVSADELDKAEEMLSHWGGEEVLLRASGVIARVALERHLFTLAETKAVTIVVNPPSKKTPGVEDVLVSLEKAGVISPIQRAQFDSLFKIANACAHPRERVTEGDVKRLIGEGRQLASVLV